MPDKTFLIILHCLSLLITTGCWDRVEIEDRGFVVGSAIDLSEAEDRSFILTNQVVIPRALGNNPGSGAGGSNKAFYNLSEQGNTMMEINRKMAVKASRSPFYPHMKVIIISEDVAKQGDLEDVVDLFIRDPEMRRGTKVFVTTGAARKVFDVKPESELYTIDYIDSVSENVRKTLHMAPIKRMGDLHEDLLENSNFIIPKLEAKKKAIEIAGGAVFEKENHTLVGFLDEEEMEGVNWLTDEVQGGVLKAKVKENYIVYEIKRAKQNISVNKEQIENLEFNITLKVEGNIAETFVSLDLFEDEEIIGTIEKRVEEQLELVTKDTIEKVQDDLNVDVIRLGMYLKQNHHGIWQKVKENWDQGENYFSKSKINVTADVLIRDTGIINKSEISK